MYLSLFLRMCKIQCTLLRSLLLLLVPYVMVVSSRLWSDIVIFVVGVAFAEHVMIENSVISIKTVPPVGITI